MQGNLNPSARAAIAAFLPPQQAAAGTVTSGWMDMRTFFDAHATLSVGVFGAGATVDAKIEQATDANGTNAKAVNGLAITQLVAAGGNNRQSVINVRQEDLDKNAGFKFVRLSVTVGVAATFVSGTLIGLDARYGAAAANQSASVAETVS
ncbi:hypothetical protein [Sphingomonas sp.]|uniref:hypothetical protein n=1 Tax=Sphingomonas sp. TaxID=28214 RepID=UPI003B005873